MKPWLVLTLGILACSTAVIFIKASHTPPVWLAAERLLLAAAVIAPFAWRDARSAGGWSAVSLRAALWPACFLALHFAAWVVAARLIPAANSTLLANFTPVVMPLVALVVLRERVTGLELLATAVGVGGVAALALGDLDASASYLMGDGLCFVAMLALAVYLALARRLRRGSLWLYMAPLFAIAGLLCACAALILEGPPPIPAPAEALLVLGLALIPTVVGHSMMNRAMGELRPQVVSLAGLGNVPSASLMAWILWREVPSPLFWVTLAAYLAALTLLALPGWRARQACVAGETANG
jgi:drug/metabolite transporter (DMT)-like permease